MSDTRTKEISFPKPIRIGGKVIKSLTMREPLVGDEIEAAGQASMGTGTNAEQEARLLCIVTGLDWEDFCAAPRGLRMMLSSQLLVFTSTPWTESDETPSSSLDSPGGSTASAV
jgi:hypothetical protein